MKGCALLMKGVYCYLFIHWLLYTINPFGINRKQQMLWRRNSKTKYLELTEGYIYRLVPKPHSVWCLFLMQIEVSGKRVPWWGCWSWSQTPCCLLSSAAAMKKESLNHSTLSHAHCGLRELPWRRGALADSCGGPRHRASTAAPLESPGSKTEPTKRGQQLLREVEKRDASPWPQWAQHPPQAQMCCCSWAHAPAVFLLCTSQGGRPPFLFSEVCTAVRAVSLSPGPCAIQQTEASQEIPLCAWREGPAFLGTKGSSGKTLGVMPACRGAERVPLAWGAVLRTSEVAPRPNYCFLARSV